MKNSNLSRVLVIALLSASTFTVAGCASSKMSSSPQTDTTPKTEYKYQDMSLGKSFYGPPRTPSQPTPPAQSQ
jgi:hypothetical protein